MQETSLESICLGVVEIGACGILAITADSVGASEPIQVGLTVVRGTELPLANIIIGGASGRNTGANAIRSLAEATPIGFVRIAVGLGRWRYARPSYCSTTAAKVTELKTLGEGVGMRRLRIISIWIDTTVDIVAGPIPVGVLRVVASWAHGLCTGS